VVRNLGAGQRTPGGRVVHADRGHRMTPNLFAVILNRILDIGVV
jgi:hypothetical protein